MQRLIHQNHYNSHNNQETHFNVNSKQTRNHLNTNQTNNFNDHALSHHNNSGLKSYNQLKDNNIRNTTTINKTNKISLTQLLDEYYNTANDFILKVTNNKITLKVSERSTYQFSCHQKKNQKNINNNHVNNQRAIPLGSIKNHYDIQKKNIKNIFSKGNTDKLQHHQHEHGRLKQIHKDNEKQNYFLNLPQKFNHNGQANYQEEEELFVFKVKDHKSNRKNSLLNALHNYQRSTSRSHSNNRSKNGASHSPKSQQRKIKSQIRISPINSKLILQNFNTNRRTNYTNEPSQQSLQVQPNYYRKEADTHKRFTLNMQQKSLINNDDYCQESKIGNKGNNFSFDQEQHYRQHTRNSQPLQQRPRFNPNYQGRSEQIQQLHTIEQVQQSIRSIQLPQNQLFDEVLSKKINNHFEQIKQNMMKQLIMRSKNGNSGIDQASMESIIQQLQFAADSIVKKYQVSFDNKNTLKKSDKINNYKNSCNLPNDPLMPDICGSDQNYIEQIQVHKKSKKESFTLKPTINDLEMLFDNLENLQSQNSKHFQQNKSKQFNQFLKNGLITNEKFNSFEGKGKIENGHGVQLKIVNESFAEYQVKQNQSDLDQFNKNKNKDELQMLNQPLKYAECSKGSSSISSIKSNIQQKIQSQNFKQKNKENNPNKDSMKAQVQSLNRYTFLKHAVKEKPQTIDIGFNLKTNNKNSIQQNNKNVYTYKEKQLDQSQYKITQNHKENVQVYNVSYNLKILSSHQKNQDKAINNNHQSINKEFNQRKSQVQVFRLSPLKFRRKEQVVEQMVKIKMIQKQSESFFRG